MIKKIAIVCIGLVLVGSLAFFLHSYTGQPTGVGTSLNEAWSFMTNLIPRNATTSDIGSSTKRIKTLYTGNINAVTTTLNYIDYTWPSSDGSNLDVLQTNGSGVLSWTPQTGGGGGSGSGYFATTVDDQLLYMTPTSLDLVIGDTSTTSDNTKFEVVGQSLFTASSTFQAGLNVIGDSNYIGYITASGFTGNASTADALKANGGNCGAGQAPLGVDASGAVESCFDVWTEAENTSAGYISDITGQSLGTLGDVATTGIATYDVLVWDGSNWVDWATTSWDTTCDGNSCAVTNTGTLDGYNGADLFEEWSTTSVDYWETQQTARSEFSTSAADHWETEQTARTADDLSDDDLDALQNVAAMTEVTGDVLYYGTSGWTRLASSTSGKVLKIDSNGFPSWGTDNDSGSGALGQLGQLTDVSTSTIGAGYSIFRNGANDSWDSTNTLAVSGAGVISASGGFSGNLTGNVTGDVSGNAGTATALFGDPTDCAANTFAHTIAASGNLTCAAVAASYMNDEDFGEFTCSGGTCTLDAESQAIDELSDVTISGPGAGYLLIYDGYTDWQDKAMSGGATIDENGLLTLNFAAGWAGRASTSEDLSCTDCIGTTEIADSYVLNTTDSMSGDLTVSGNTTTTNLGITGIVTAGTQCLQINTNGVVTGTGSACGSGGSNWTFGANYGVTTLTPSTTMAVWLKDALYASSTIKAGDTTTSDLYTDQLGLNSEYFTDLTGTGLLNTALALTLDYSRGWAGKSSSTDVTGDWTGILDGYEGSVLYNTTSTQMANDDFGEFTCDGTDGGCTIDADTIALTTDTTGNYVQSIADAGNKYFTITNGVAEGGAVTIDFASSTEFEAAYTHSQDNTQAHSDYLLNNANDTTSGKLTITGGLIGVASSTFVSTLNTIGKITADGGFLSTASSTVAGTLDVTSNFTVGGNATTTGDVVIGADGAAQAGCMAIQDTDASGWTYCRTLDGTMTCNTTSCSGSSTSTLIIGR